MVTKGRMYAILRSYTNNTNNIFNYPLKQIK